MKITYSISKEDLWNYNKHVLYNNFKGKLNLVLSIIVLPILIYIAIFYVANSKIGALVASGFILVFAYYMRFPYLKKKVFKLAESGKHILEEKTLEIEMEGISQVSCCTNGSYKWNAIHKIEMTHKYVFIFVDQVTAIIIPKRIFKLEDEFILFYNTAMKYFQDPLSGPVSTSLS
ncbi:MAG: YcxB family protein [Anaeromicrobium sp.]|uniref:YcxB family protein n=1 Tax=Anaeromicrobium sp. TaxID=1929132 RepID=UPI0025FA79AB|nr:YcxB family protein [Anaeromicrobium sp.]MCT4595988.1 YcxB family protein [Anaeromicrobium sp.]